jgi:hypothetical protein
VGKAWLVLPAIGIAGLLKAGTFLWPLTVPWWIWIALLIIVLAGISRFMWFLVLFTGYWVVFWQQYISLPGYVHGYINAKADVELILVTDGITVICLTVLVNYLIRKIPAFQAVILGTLITSLAWLVIAFRPTVWAPYSPFLFWHSEKLHNNRVTTNTSPALPRPDSRELTWGLRFSPSGSAR